MLETWSLIYSQSWLFGLSVALLGSLADDQGLSYSPQSCPDPSPRILPTLVSLTGQGIVLGPSPGEGKGEVELTSILSWPFSTYTSYTCESNRLRQSTWTIPWGGEWGGGTHLNLVLTLLHVLPTLVSLTGWGVVLGPPVNLLVHHRVRLQHNKGANSFTAIKHYCVGVSVNKI